MDDLLLTFLTEANENIDALDHQLVRFEHDPNNNDLLSEIFRAIHTIKGNCGFLGLSRLETLTHQAESVLEAFRDGSIKVSAEHVTIILSVIDRVRVILGALTKNGIEAIGNDDDLIHPLKAILSQIPNARTFNKLAAFTPSVEDHTAEIVPEQTRSLRINMNTLENMMMMVSELVLVRNQLTQISRHHKKSPFAPYLLQLNQIVTDLQDNVLKTRMQPIGVAWQKLPRILRDTAHELGKEIRLIMLGQETELDRQLLDVIKDPLAHMVRNAADHGIELPAARRAAGKPETGTITLNASHANGFVVINITDDGQGLSLDRIRATILQKGMASEETLHGLTAEQIYRYILQPGFSTAETISSISGRGVGLDVVCANIAKINGTVDLQSTPGCGTCFSIRIPLTLAIIPALIVETAGQRFAYPQTSIREVILLSDDTPYTIEVVNQSQILHVREQLVPLFNLHDILENASDTTTLSSRPRYIIIAQVGQTLFGIGVDHVHDTEDIVVKPLPHPLRHIDIFAGAAIQGDGSVMMILDPAGLSKHAGHLNNMPVDTVENPMAIKEERTPFLIFSTGDGNPKAVPLAFVSRLERFETRLITTHDDSYAVQYRGHLLSLQTTIPDEILQIAASVPVMVFQDGAQKMGLIVQAIKDIIEETATIDIGSARPGIIGSTIMHGQTTDIIDVSYYLEKNRACWLHKIQTDLPQAGSTAKHRLLLVDDSVFFRNMMTPFLKMAGYDVMAVGSPQDALHLQKSGATFDLIISDIEMPEMDGYDLARAIRAASGWEDTPLLALTTHIKPEDIKRGQTVGFQDHISKFDRESLLSHIAATLLHYKDMGGLA